MYTVIKPCVLTVTVWGLADPTTDPSVYVMMDMKEQPVKVVSIHLKHLTIFHHVYILIFPDSNITYKIKQCYYLLHSCNSMDATNG